MGHLSAKQPYLDLQQRLDKMPIGAPFHRDLMTMLEELFTTQECRVGSAMPLRLATADKIAKSAGITEKETTSVLDGLAGKGLVLDLPRDDRPTLYILNPTIVGFIEFTMMRTRQDIDQKKVAELIWSYLAADPEKGFMRMLGDGETFIARPLVNEKVLLPEIYSEVLEWEKASEIIEQSDAWAEGICHCRHVKLHHGKSCDYPLRHCLSFGHGARYLVRNGMAKTIERAQAHEIVEHAKNHGLVQMADNIRNRPTFICNCCKCCCEIMKGLRELPDMATVVSSNFVASCDDLNCTGCGKCDKACPIDAIAMVAATPTAKTKKRKLRAVVDGERCLGCGVCHTVCREEAVVLAATPQRVYTPENVLDKAVRQALERDKLQHLLFSDPSRLTHRTLAALLGTLLRLPPAKQILATKQLKSTFVNLVLNTLKAGKKKKRPAKKP